jgi:hypothetical protein
MSKHLIESKIIINTPLKKVWEVLANLDDYHQWNPFTPKVECSKKIGADVLMQVRLNPNSKKTIKQKETLLVWEDQARIEWGIQEVWYVKTVRIQKLTPIDENTTEYYTSDAFEGPLTGFILWLYGNKIQIGFDDVSKALKTKAEQL